MKNFINEIKRVCSPSETFNPSLQIYSKKGSKLKISNKPPNRNECVPQ